MSERRINYNAAPALRAALEALGAMPEGYCFCFHNDRDPRKSIADGRRHTGECLHALRALEEARE